MAVFSFKLNALPLENSHKRGGEVGDRGVWEGISALFSLNQRKDSLFFFGWLIIIEGSGW